MNQAFKISIPTPCSEDFSQMSPDEQGRFCQSCQKSVIDFSKTTRKEFEQTVLGAKDELCGRVPVQWLSQPKPTYRVSGSTLARLRTFVVAMLMVFGPAFFGIIGLSKAAVQADLLAYYCAELPIVEGPEKIISGVVIDAVDGEPAINATIRLLVDGKHYGEVVTAFDGRFAFKLPEALINGGNIELEVGWLGFTERYKPELIDDKPLILSIEAIIELPEISISVYTYGYTTGVIAVERIDFNQFGHNKTYSRFQPTVEEVILMKSSEVNMREF